VFHLILAMTDFCQNGTDTAQEPGSLFWYHAVINVRLLLAKAGFETEERTVLLLVFIS